MFRFIAKFRRGIFITLLAAMPLVLLFAQTRHPATRGPVVGIIVDAAGGIERLLLIATGWISDGLNTYITSIAAVDELSALRRQERFSLGLMAKIREVELENERLRKLANLAARIDGPQPLGANIIGRSGSPLTRIARIDRGRSDGIQRGDAVVSARGVVGRILTAGSTSADVLLLTDPTSSIDVVVQRTREQGLVQGVGADNAYRVQVQDFDRLADVETGDVLLTSGLDEHIPPGLFVGVITKVTERDDKLYQQAEVQPGAPLATLENVLVFIHRAPKRRPRLAHETAKKEIKPRVDESSAALEAPSQRKEEQNKFANKSQKKVLKTKPQIKKEKSTLSVKSKSLLTPPTLREQPREKSIPSASQKIKNKKSSQPKKTNSSQANAAFSSGASQLPALKSLPKTPSQQDETAAPKTAAPKTAAPKTSSQKDKTAAGDL